MVTAKSQNAAKAQNIPQGFLCMFAGFCAFAVTTEMTSRVVGWLVSYLLGSIPTAYLVVKWLKRVDVRTIGSGNVGATNVTRAAGFWPGVAVCVLDMAKGLMTVLIIAPGLIQTPSLADRLSCGLAAVIGHIFPLFLRFKGGKGVATTIGVLLGTMPLVTGIWALIWSGCFAIWRYVSIGSLAAMAALPLIQLALHQHPMDVVLGGVLSLLVIIKHRGNIVRLAQGQEHRVGSSRVIDKPKGP